VDVPISILAVELAVYIAIARLILRRLEGAPREILFGLWNLAGVFVFLFYNHQQGDYRSKFILYLLVVFFQYVMLRMFSQAKGRLPWLAFFTPIAVLLVVRYVPNEAFVWVGRAAGRPWHGVPNLIGISYLSFRCSRLVLEIRNGSVKPPGLWEYLNFAFFLPTMSVGPINTYANFRRGFAATPWDVPAGRAALRVLAGLVKYLFLSGLCDQLAYQGLMHNSHPHHWVDLPVAMTFYYLHLYCNFSGFCDMAIGAAGLIGVPVPENFDNPFAARNIKDFWNRWHITLSQWMRDIVFAPLSKFLVRVMGPARVNEAIAATIIVVFLLIGIWHGVGWNYAVFGLVHALGLVINHYYTLGLKQRLGREGFKAYNENRWIHAAAVGLTFMYCAASLMFFANTLPQIQEIFQTLR